MATRNGLGAKGGSLLTGQGTGGGSQTGSNWTNLSQYLDNNKGAGEGMADDITKGAQGEIERLDKQGGAVDTWDTEAKKEVDTNTRQDTYSNTIQNGAAKDVAGIDQNAYSAWSALGNYTGAKDASGTQGYDQVYKDVNNAKDQVKNLGSYDGQKAALSNTYGKSGGYGKGFQNLDAFALNGDASGQAKLQGFQQQNANFGQKFDNSVAGVTAYAGGAADRGKAVMDKTTAAINSRYSAIDQTGQDAARADDGGLQANLDAINKMYAEAGVDAPTTVSGLTGTPRSTVDQFVTAQAGQAGGYLSEDEIAAANKLSGIGAGGGPIAKGQKASTSVSQADWERILADIQARKPKAQSAASTATSNTWTAGGTGGGSSTTSRSNTQR